MTFEIKNKETGNTQPCTVRPLWVSGIWECGDFRITDQRGNAYEVVETFIPPTVSRPRFKMLWTSAERAAIKELRQTDATVDAFMELLDDPQTTDIMLALPSVQRDIQYVIAHMPVELVPENQRVVRFEKIIAGQFA